MSRLEDWTIEGFNELKEFMKLLDMKLVAEIDKMDILNKIANFELKHILNT